jgi:putative DNA primase/helicase
VNKTQDVKTNVLWLATGNNLVFSGDMSTRAIKCRIDSGVEEPEKRKFSVNLRRYVPEHRAELVAAALTVLRAFIVAGSPGAEELEAFGRFEAWSMLIRAALVWLGEPDPCISRESIARDDPVRAFAGSLIEMLEAAFPGKEFTAQEAIEAGRATDEVSS